MKTATLVKGKVKFKAGAPFSFKHGDRINVMVTPDNGGEDIRVYDNPGAPIQFLEKGDEISLLFDGTNYLMLETADKLPTPTNGNGHSQPSRGTTAMATPITHPSGTTPAPTIQRALSPDVIEWVNIYEEIKAAMPDAQETTWRAAASTVFIQRFQTGEGS